MSLRVMTIGRPKTRFEMHGKCERCGVSISWLSSAGNPIIRKACGECRAKVAGDSKRKLPDDQTLYRLYVKENRPTTEIATMYGTEPRSVGKLLKVAGIEMRRHTVVLRCKVAGCPNRPMKIRHTNNGADYGSLCKAHREEHREGLRVDYYAKVVQPGKPVIDKFKRALAKASKVNRSRILDNVDDLFPDLLPRGPGSV